MRKQSYVWKITCCAAALLALGSFVRPEPAHAQFGGIIGGIDRRRPPAPSGRRWRRRSAATRERASRHDSSSDDSSSDKSSSSGRETIRATTGCWPRSARRSSSVQTSVLKSVVSSGLLGVVGSTQDLTKVGQTSSKDDDRDWTGRIQRIVDRFKREQDKRITTPGDVTEHAIEQSLEAAFKKAKLDTFESFLGENWSAERLRVTNPRPGRRRSAASVRRQQPRQRADAGSRQSHPARRRIDLPAHLRGLRAPGREPQLDAVRAAPLPDPWRSGGRSAARARRRDDHQGLECRDRQVRRGDAPRRQRLCAALPRATHRVRLPVGERRADHLVGNRHRDHRRDQAEDREDHPVGVRRAGSNVSSARKRAGSIRRSRCRCA